MFDLLDQSGQPAPPRPKRAGLLTSLQTHADALQASLPRALSHPLDEGEDGVSAVQVQAAAIRVIHQSILLHALKYIKWHGEKVSGSQSSIIFPETEGAVDVWWLCPSEGRTGRLVLLVLFLWELVEIFE